MTAHARATPDGDDAHGTVNATLNAVESIIDTMLLLSPQAEAALRFRLARLLPPAPQQASPAMVTAAQSVATALLAPRLAERPPAAIRLTSLEAAQILTALRTAHRGGLSPTERAAIDAAKALLVGKMPTPRRENAA